MAQQLATMRTAAAYAGVTAYARSHTGEAASAAYLALGHAYLLDRRYHDAEISFREALDHDGELGDYADYLDAEASHAAGDDAAAEKLLHGFSTRYPDSVFVDQAPVLEANVLLALNNATGAQKALAAAEGTDEENTPAFQLADAQVAQALGQSDTAVSIFKQLLLGHPLTSEAEAARQKLMQMGAGSTLTVAELRSLGDAYYRAGRFSAAAEQYRALAHNSTLSAEERQGFDVAEAACELGLDRLSLARAEALPDTNDENGARRLYLLMELARDRQDASQQKSIVEEMERRFPQSPWLEEALFSSGNMYLLRHDYPAAIEYYAYLADNFPRGGNAPAANWRAGWLSYRMGQYDAASKLFAQEIKLYPDASESISALYWSGRLFERQNHAPALAATNYRDIVVDHPNYYYAQLARVRLNVLGQPEPATASATAPYPHLPKPLQVDAFPTDRPHLAKARLLANAGLNEYVAPEIAADSDWSSWGSLGEAQIYASYDETFLALRAMKRAIPDAASATIQSIPLAYWRILFPEPWWETIKTESARYNLDPYLVLSLIRQESEFNSSAISYAGAYGLMQLLPSVGRVMARQVGMRNFRTYQLLDPETNIRLGTRYLRQMLDKFGGVQEYALAAYNAGDYRVTDWQSAGPYTGMDEFVESIPFTQTRTYVEAILRNEQTYKLIDAYARDLSSGGEKTALR
ncbi:MAG TPA: transglycosylase SLT domain-containing protein [Caulobacteraceae bacterium]|nr:transglycosylase SLT domain-containing protein [Caulobacteraceae bacterium]